MQSESALKHPSHESVLAAAEAAIKEVIRALAIEVPQDTDSSPLCREVTASVHQELGNELHLGQDFQTCHVAGT